jgi:hypothetical protein
LLAGLKSNSARLSGRRTIEKYKSYFFCSLLQAEISKKRTLSREKQFDMQLYNILPNPGKFKNNFEVISKMGIIAQRCLRTRNNHMLICKKMEKRNL